MSSDKLKDKFNKLERQISMSDKTGTDKTQLLKEKIDILKTSYEKLSDAINSGEIEMIAANFAKEIAFLNNIKDIQLQLNEPTTQTDAEIQKIHEQMRNKGLGWILDNMPEKKS